MLFNNGFSGPLPTSIGLLGELKELLANDNYFSETIPDEISNLSNLSTW